MEPRPDDIIETTIDEPIRLQKELQENRKMFNRKGGLDIHELVESYVEWSGDEFLMESYAKSELIKSVADKSELAQKVIIGRWMMRHFFMVKTVVPEGDFLPHVTLLSPTMNTRDWLRTIQYKLIGVFRDEEEKVEEA